MRRRPARSELFPVNVWPPFVDALALVLAAFVMLMLVVLAVQQSLTRRVRERESEVESLRVEKTRVERRLQALAAAGTVEIDEGKVILQGEVLFDSGSDQLRPVGRQFLDRLARQLAELLASEKNQMVLIGGHTDDRSLRHEARFASNWELSSARAVAVSHVLLAAGIPAHQIVAAGFGAEHPRAANGDDSGRRQNRRIEVLLVPIRSVASR